MTLLERVIEWLAPAPRCTCQSKRQTTPKKKKKATKTKKIRGR